MIAVQSLVAIRSPILKAVFYYKAPDGKIVQVSVEWTFTKCDLKTGVFQVLVHPGKYHVSFTGYPLTLPPNAEIGGTNLPLSVTVERHQLTQVEIGISHGI